MDLRDLYRRRGGRSRLTFRLVALLIDKLPPESATKTRERNKYSPEQLRQISKGQRDHGPWSQLELLVAQVVDEIGALIHVTAGGKGPKPKPFPRPGIAGTGAMRRGRLTPAQMRKLAAVRAADPPPNPTPLRRATP